MTASTFLHVAASRLAALLMLAACAHAAPSIRYSWDGCDPLVLNRDFAGPGHYTQTISVVGLVLPGTTLQMSIEVGPGLPSAWSFYFSGCQGESRLTVGTVAEGSQAIPGLLVTARLAPPITEPGFRLHITAAAPPGFTPDPTARYALAVVDFDHSATTTGLVDPPGRCGGGDLPFCFGIESLSLNGGLPGRDFVLEDDLLTWNLASTPGRCPFPVAARSSTWGRLKAIYR